MVKTNSAVLLLSKLCNSRLSWVPNNLYGLSEMLNVDEGAAHVDNRLRKLQRQSVLQIQNARFIPAFLSSNVRNALLFQNESPAFFNNARSASNARPALPRLQNVRPTFLTLNAMAAFQQKLRAAFQLNARSAFQQENA